MRTRRAHRIVRITSARARPRTGRTCHWSVLLSLVGLFLAALAGPARSQEPADVESPAQRAAHIERLTAESEAAKAEAVAWALQTGMAVREDDGHRTRELMALLGGRPLYYTTANVQSATSIATDRVRDIAPWQLDGDGWAVGVWDAAGVRRSHQEFVGADGQSRVTVRDSIVLSDHSTHVAGTIAAAGVDPNAVGMAPRARIESYDWNNDAAQMYTHAATGPGQAHSLYVSNHSYSYLAGWEYVTTGGTPLQTGWHFMGSWAGANSYEEWFGAYISVVRTWDDVAYMNPYYLAFAAAGNDRNDGPKLGDTVYYWSGSAWHEITYSPETCPRGDGEVKGGYGALAGHAVAKNIVTVGAVYEALADGVRSCARPAMTVFSGWGPTDDGRIKPDIVANGTNVYSATSRTDTTYDTYDGTSMASPAAAGSAILLVQLYDRLFPGQAMRASTLKALILHTADDLGRPGPDYCCGWGLMNTRAAADLIQEHRDSPAGDLIVEGLLDAQNAADSYYLYADGTGPIRVTLCWTDPAATATIIHDDPAAKLINDLDLRLIGPGGVPTYYPYTLNPSDPPEVARTGDNKLDNVEQVYIPAPDRAGIYQVRVAYKRALTNSKQDYSLVSSLPLSGQGPPMAEDSDSVVPRDAWATLTLKANDEGLPNPPGRVSYTLVSLPRYGRLEYPGGGTITEPTLLAQNANEVVYRPAAGYIGEDSFTFTADDGGTPPFAGVSNTATVRISVQNLVVQEYRIAASADDTLADGSYQPVSGSYLRLGGYVVALRFQAINVPAGTPIDSARLELYAGGVSKCDGAIYAQATGDAPDFTGDHQGVISRSKTKASVAWNWQGSEPTNAWYSSPNLNSVVQEVFDRPDWQAGNALVLLYVGKTPGAESMYFHAWEKNHEQAPKLVIAYTPASSASTSGPGTMPATAQPGSAPPAVASTTSYVGANTPALVTLEASDDGQPGPLSVTIDTLPGHGSLTHPVGPPVAKGATLRADARQLVYTPQAGFTGDDSFTFHASDRGTAPSGGNSKPATVSLRVRHMVTRQYQVIVPEDDAYGAAGETVISSDELSVGRYDSAVRFRNVDIPPLGEIVGADLKINVSTSPVTRRIEGVIAAQAVGNAADFTPAALRLPNLPRTQATIPWTWPAGESWAVGTFCPSPDISAAVQEVIDRPDWLIDNALVILYSGDGKTGGDLRFAACNSLYRDRAARLEITYGVTAETLLPPTFNPTVPVAQDAQTECAFNAEVKVTLSATDDGRPDPPGKLAYAIASLPSHGTLRLTGGAAVSVPGLLPASDDQVVYQPQPGFVGLDSFTFYADDGASPALSGMSNIATVAIRVRPPLTQKLTTLLRVQRSEDDAFAAPRSASNNLTEMTLRVGLNTSAMRFTDVNIPQGSKILEAHLEINLATRWLPQGVISVVQAEATGNAASFAGANRHICELLRTDAYADWLWKAGSYTNYYKDYWQTSPDIAGVIQEVVDRPDWAAGNAIAIVFWSQNIPLADLEFCAYDNSPTSPTVLAPKLAISYAPNRGTQSASPTDGDMIPPNATTLTYEVRDARDDTSAHPLSPVNAIYEPYLKMGTRISAMRFTQVKVPRGSRVLRARLKISIMSIQITNRIEGMIQAEATGNAPDFAAAERYLYQLPRTAASVDWPWEAGDYVGRDADKPPVSSPDISQIIQEIVDRADWAPGNAMAIIYSGKTQPTQDLRFTAYDWTDPFFWWVAVRSPPILEITYVP
jgi:hypothetical protein